MRAFSNARSLSLHQEDSGDDLYCPLPDSNKDRRKGLSAPCRARLLGWILNVADRSTTWGDVDISAFCRIAKYSREHAMRELAKIRKERLDLRFETKIRKKSKTKKAVWGVMVCSVSKLKFDGHSLFYTRSGRALHNRTKLGPEGEKISPPNRPVGSSKQTDKLPPLTQKISIDSAQTEIDAITPGLCDIPYKEKDFYEIQQINSYGAKRDLKLCQPNNSKTPPIAIRKKAFSLVRSIANEHHDNSKVEFSSKHAFSYAVDALWNGHDTKKIIGAYAKAHQTCHAIAVDHGASAGKVIFFSPSSTVAKARADLANDGLSRKERIERWYQLRRETIKTKPSQIKNNTVISSQSNIFKSLNKPNEKKDELSEAEKNQFKIIKGMANAFRVSMGYSEK